MVLQRLCDAIDMFDNAQRVECLALAITGPGAFVTDQRREYLCLDSRRNQHYSCGERFTYMDSERVDNSRDP
jgi:hypothetical protein